MTTVTLIPGDGIGPEIVDSVQQIFSAAQVPIQWETINAGITAYEQTGKHIPDDLIASIRNNKIALKGPIGTPIGTGFRSINVTLRMMFDLYINLRPARSIPGVESRYENIDIVLFRENTEGLYSGLETFDARLQIADAINRITKAGSERIIRAAFDYARKNGRKRVTLIHKANIMKLTSGLFLNTGKEIATEYSDIEFKEMIVDNACMQLVLKPEQFDVVVTTNMFGDILSDLMAGLVGGLGVVPGANIGKDLAVFEAVHGTAPDIAGQGKANPTALLLSGLMMLRYMQLNSHADRIETALFATLKNKTNCTADLGGACTTQQFTQNIIAALPVTAK